MAGWADTPRDILESVFERLGNDLKANLNFGGVCRNWRALAADKDIDILPRIMLVDTYRICPMYIPDLGQLLTLSPTNNVYNIHPNTCAKISTQRYLGLFDGMLITVDKNSGGIQLLNPILGSKIPLPIPSLHGLEQQEARPLHKIVISSLIANTGYVIFFRLVSEYIHFCRLGDESWTTLKIHFGGVRDVASYQHKLYVINTNRNIDVFDLQVPEFANYLIKLHDPAYSVEKRMKLQEKYYADIKLLHVPRDFDGIGTFSRVYMLNTPEDVLLMVVMYGKTRYDTVGFKVFEQVKGGDDWLPVESLVQKALFIGQHSSLCLTADNALKCQENSIYFINSDSWSDSGIFSMETGKIKPLYQECLFKVFSQTWFIPNIRPNLQLPI